MNCPYTLDSILEAHVVERAVEAERGRARIGRFYLVLDGHTLRLYCRCMPLCLGSAVTSALIGQ